jgi:hypothetical protein
MATSPSAQPDDAEMVPDVLHQLKQMTEDDPAFAEALRRIDTTEQAAELIHQHGLEITSEALWRHRGKLMEGGRPTWPG